MNEDIGQRIKEKRKKLRLTQDDLAGPSLSRGMISLIERDQTTPTIKTLSIIASKLGVSVGDLLGENQSPDSTLQSINAEKLLKMSKALLNNNKGSEAEEILLKIISYTNEQQPFKGEALKLLAEYKRNINLHESTDFFKNSLNYITPMDINIHIEIYYGLSLNYRLSGEYYLCLENALYANILIKSNIYEKYDPLLHLKILYELSFSYSRIGQYNLTLDVINEALEIMSKSLLSYKLASFQMIKGLAELYLNKFEDGVNSNLKALKLLKDRDDLIEIIGTKTNLGILYRHLNLYQEAISYLSESTVEAEKLGNIWYLVNNFYELSLTYQSINNFEEARKVALKGLEMSEDNKLTIQLLIVLSEISLVNNENEVAHEYIDSAIIKLKDIDDMKLHSKCLLIKGDILTKDLKHDSANNIYRESIVNLL
ncbi:MAG: helix-turn-helix transcriptional regulator [Bacillota bacterium]|nr:helix-turn-helix transcriptional regulator [Bacillota bacterium]